MTNEHAELYNFINKLTFDEMINVRPYFAPHSNFDNSLG